MYEEKMIGKDYTKDDLLKVVPNAKTVPQIFVEDEYIGGYTELMKFLLQKKTAKGEYFCRTVTVMVNTILKKSELTTS